MTWMHAPYEDSGGEEYNQEDEQGLGELSADAQAEQCGTIVSLAVIPEPFISEDGEN